MSTRPCDSVKQKSECETVARNIATILSQKDDVFRLMTEQEYLAERISDIEKNPRINKSDKASQIHSLQVYEMKYFCDVAQYLESAEKAAAFSPSWQKILFPQ